MPVVWNALTSKHQLPKKVAIWIYLAQNGKQFIQNVVNLAEEVRFVMIY